VGLLFCACDKIASQLREAAKQGKLKQPLAVFDLRLKSHQRQLKRPPVEVF
jgi:hypothetical protein